MCDGKRNVILQEFVSPPLQAAADWWTSVSGPAGQWEETQQRSYSQKKTQRRGSTGAAKSDHWPSVPFAASGFVLKKKMWDPKTVLLILACLRVSSAADVNGKKIKVHSLLTGHECWK